ncbi:hypothetical protein U1Q18_052198 [Sarracenia purpurea var. burkii]
MACRTKGKSGFVAELIKNNAEVNFRTVCHHKTLIHIAVQYSDPETLQILLANKNCDVNASDHNANTAIHIAVKRNKIHAVSILLQHARIDVNKLDQRRNTPLHLALSLNHQQIIRQLLKRSDIDLDKSKDLHNHSCRQIISKKYPHLDIELLRNPSVDLTTSQKLFLFLYERDTKSFIDRAESDKSVLFTGKDEFFTYLQLACDSGLGEVIDKLLTWHVDPNECCLYNTQTPIMIAAEKGYHEIVRRLLEDPLISLDPINQETVLHSLFRGMLAAQCDTNETVDEVECDHRKCLEYILDSIPRTQLDVNFGDRQGNTALHYAAKLNDEQIVLLLLNAGFYVCHRNHAGVAVLQLINPAVLKRYLDSCVSTNDESWSHSNHQIILNCKIFQPPDNHSQISEIEPLLVLNEIQELRNLLEHPVLTAFLQIKLLQTRMYYYFYIAFYVMFCIALGLHVFYGVCNHYEYTNRSELTSVTWTSDTATLNKRNDMKKCVMVLYVFLVVRVCIQFFFSVREYFKWLENYLEMFSIILTFFILYNDFHSYESHMVATIAIFTASFKLIVLMGRLPSLSIVRELMKTATFNFLKFLGFYSILFLAFAFFFLILYQRNTVVADSCQNPFFNIGNIILLLFTTPNDLAKNSNMENRLGINHVLFVSNMLFITILISSGLTVCNTDEIRNNARLLDIVSQMGCIRYVDTAFYFDRLPFIHRYATLKKLSARTRLFPYTLLDCLIRILPNDNMTVLLVDDSDDSLKYSTWKVEIDIVKQAREILEKCKPRDTVDYQRFFKKHDLPKSPDINSKSEYIYVVIDEGQESQNQCTKTAPVMESTKAADDADVQHRGIPSNIDTDSDSTGVFENHDVPQSPDIESYIKYLHGAIDEERESQS